MKCIKIIAQLLLIIISLCTCDNDFFYSKVPISNVKHSSIDSSIIGYWAHAGQEYGGFDIYMKILPLNDKELIIDLISRSEELEIPCDATWYTFNGHVTEIDTCFYYNLKNIDKALEGNKNIYCFFSFILKEDSLYTYFLHKDFEMEPKTSREFKKYILNNHKLFTSQFVYGYEFKRYNSDILFEHSIND